MYMSLKRQIGMTLIEVLVAVLVTATGVMGAAALQLNAVKFNHTANTRSAAVFLANDIADRLRANRASALLGGYDIALDDDAPTGTAINQLDLQEWLSELAARLPAGDGAVVRNGNTFTVTLQWDEGRLNKTRETGAGNTQSFVFVTEL